MDVYGIAVIDHRLRCAGYKTLRLRILQDTGEDAGNLIALQKINVELILQPVLIYS
jgi:hypothetical protein